MAKPKLGNELSSGGLSELKRRLFFVLIGILVFRLGAYIPVPGVNPSRLFQMMQQHSSGLLGMFNMFSGGSLSRMTVFALSIMPYISASIIVQMYSAVSPQLKALQKEGEAGRRKINQYTRFGTLGLAIVEGFGLCKWLAGSGAVYHVSFGFYFIGTLTLVAGTMFLMWLGEQMTERGVGNGISMIIFSGIAARLPEAFGSVILMVKQGSLQPIVMIFIVAIVALVVLVVVKFERAQRRIRIEYAKRQQGRKMYAAQSSYFPMKINMAGVIPVIFAQSLILFPTTLANFFATSKGFSWLGKFTLFFQQGTLGYILAHTVLVIFFAFFYTALVFNPKETADNLKRSGAYIPGIRPGEQTAKYIDGVMTRLTLVGSLYLAIVSLLPEFMLMEWKIPPYFGGTSLLIVVVVIMDFMAQVQAHLMSHQYESLMKKSKSRGSKMSLMR